MMVLHKTSDQYLPIFKVSTWSISMFKRYRLKKKLTKNFNTKFLSPWPWPQGHPGWVMMVQHKTSDHYLLTCKVSTWSISMFKRYRLMQTLTKIFNTKLTKIFNTKFLSLWPWPQGHPGWVMMVLHETSDQYLVTCKVSTWSISMIMRYGLIKTLTKNLNIWATRTLTPTPGWLQ